jgi:hypothetical protein
MREFRDDDAGYLAWLAAHPNGYVINILRSHNATEARVHHADCRTINGQNPLAAGWTSQYVKVCAEQLAELDQWASDQVGGPIPRCQTCHPARHPAQPTSTNRTEQAMASVLPEGRSKVQGPVAGRAVVEAWADDYIRFERRPDWQTKLRAEIRSCCGHLEPSAEQVLHATFFGAKHPGADVENVALYYIDSFAVAGRNGIRFEHGATVPPDYIDSFAVAGRNGIRFEHGATVPPAPDGAEYPFCYRYAFEPRSGAFADWQQGRTLASFDWTDLGAFVGKKRVAQVWLALVRREIEVARPACAPDTPFAVRVQLRPLPRWRPRWPDTIRRWFARWPQTVRESPPPGR